MDYCRTLPAPGAHGAKLAAPMHAPAHPAHLQHHLPHPHHPPPGAGHYPAQMWGAEQQHCSCCSRFSMIDSAEIMREALMQDLTVQNAAQPLTVRRDADAGAGPTHTGWLRDHEVSESQLRKREADRRRRADPEVQARRREAERLRRARIKEDGRYFEVLQRKREADRRRRADPEVQARRREAERLRRADPEIQAKRREAEKQRRANPDFQQRRRESDRLRRTDPDVLARRREAERIRRSNPDVQERRREAERRRRADPDFQERKREAERLRRAQHGALDALQLGHMPVASTLPALPLGLADPEMLKRKREAEKMRRADPEVKRRRREAERIRRARIKDIKGEMGEMVTPVVVEDESVINLLIGADRANVHEAVRQQSRAILDNESVANDYARADYACPTFHLSNLLY